MITVTVAVVIARPVEDVFEFVSDFENNLKWRASQADVEKTSEGPIGVGTTYRIASNLFGRRFEGESVVTEFEPNRKYASKDKSGYFPIDAQRLFEPVEGGTRVTFILKPEPSGVFNIAEPLLAPMVKRRIEADVARLKALLEAAAV